MQKADFLARKAQRDAEGADAMVEYRRDQAKARENMLRLRALRLAAVAAEPVPAPPVKRKPRKKAVDTAMAPKSGAATVRKRSRKKEPEKESVSEDL